MRILIVGSKGQLGNELKRCLDSHMAEIGPIPSVYDDAVYDLVDFDTLDVSDAESVDGWFSRNSYDLVINCAAMTNVDGCETREEEAFAVNALGAKYLSRVSSTQGAKFVQVSTDYVFSGALEGERLESDQVGPVSAYGRSKLAGEQFALQENPATFVVRTAWLYGYKGRNFVKTMLSLASNHEKVTVVDDQRGNPTSANDLAYEILRIAETQEYGIYHCTNEGVCSWADFAEEIFRIQNTGCTVERCTSDEYRLRNPLSANRPCYSGLRNARLESSIGNEMRPWKEALRDYLSNYQRLAD